MEREPFHVEGSLDAITSAIAASGKAFYVYVLFRPDGEPFYVGKGVLRRVTHHESEARNTSRRSHKLNVIRAIHRTGATLRYAIADFFVTESEAHTCERKLILKIGRHDLGTGPLTNQTDGGEGTSNPSVESRERRAANLGGEAPDPDRRVVNKFFHDVAGPQGSVSIKPLGVRTLEFTVPHAKPRKPTQRMATTLVAAAIASDGLLAPGGLLPRAFFIDGRPVVIENGAAKDMAKAGMISVVSRPNRPEDEHFHITRIGFEAVIGFFGRDKLVDLGVIEP